MFILWQHTLTRPGTNAFKETKNSSERLKLNNRLVSPCYIKNYKCCTWTRLIRFFWIASLTSSFLALSTGFHLIHLPRSWKYQPRFQKLANLGFQLLPQVHRFPRNSLCLIRTQCEKPCEILKNIVTQQQTTTTSLFSITISIHGVSDWNTINNY